ncbi:HAMP domain-containing protein [Eubacterium ruminantium]|nr:HAMP domain-containing protein [Eubacterium ruminantium]
MKQFARIIIVFCVVYVLGILIFALMTDSSDSLKTDTLKLNDIVQKVSENRDSLQNLDNEDFGVGFVVLDRNNKVTYTRLAEGESEKLKDDAAGMTVERAVKNRYPYRYLEDSEGMITGVVVMLDNAEEGYAVLRTRIIIFLGLGGLVILAASIGLGFYIRKNIITPFRKMEDFAGKVAEGKLDEPLLMEENNMFGVFTESFDIMREELAASKERELELQRKEKELVASLSHDLKTPITGIKLTTELLKAKLAAEEAAEDEVDNEPVVEDDRNTAVNRAADGLSIEAAKETDGAAMEAVKDAGNKEAGKRRKRFPDMNEKLDNIYKKADQIDVLVSDLFTSTLDDLGEFKVNCRDEESMILSEIIRKIDDRKLIAEESVPSVIINIDSKRMNQVIGNIIVNSYKYAGTAINVSYRLVDRYLEMSIRDHGPGVPEEELELITNKFYRGKKVEKTRKEGSGLGLYISRNLMHKMNGELICRNGDEESGGLVITLVIPLS